MPITYAQALPAGNAVLLSLDPPAGAVWWRVLRRPDADFTGPLDGDAELVADGSTDTGVLDVVGLANGTTYFYCLYSWDGVAYTASDAVSVAPATQYGVTDTDVQTLVLERVALGLAAEVAAGRLKPETGVIPVVTAPYALADGVPFPVVSVHLGSEGTADRAVGEAMGWDTELPDGSIGSETGVFERTSLNIAGVSLNGDERLALRKALKRILIANLEVFSGLGLLNIEWSFSDDEDFSGQGANLFFTRGTFSCLSQTSLSTSAAPVTVTVTLGFTNNGR